MDDDGGVLDVVIVGAGLSGINAAMRLRRGLPDARFAIVEARAALGGTWDVFRYPGVRADSDMHTLGYPLRPWRSDRAIVGGDEILRYLEAAAREEGLVDAIRLGTRVERAAWSSADAAWTLALRGTDGGAAPSLRARFLWLCAGYFRHDRGHRPAFEGEETFAGPIVHPQHWPVDLETAGRRVVVVGSGATAVTLVPALAGGPGAAAHATMLQRSASDVVALPSRDRLAAALLRRLPPSVAGPAVRWKNVLLNQATFALARRFPHATRRALVGRAARALGSAEVARAHFSPRHAPWRQRVCVAPDGDFFRAIRDGRASVVTGAIERLDPTGVVLADGRRVDADVIVAATGLELQTLGGIEVEIDGEAFDPAASLSYRGAMLAGLPNAANVFGYTNASWTLKSDLIARFVVRLLARMRRRGDAIVVARAPPGMEPRALVDFTSGYFLRALARLPRQGDRGPWRQHQSVLRDTLSLAWAPIDDGALRFGPAGRLPP